MKRKPVDEQVVVVMEAAGGIGRQTALELARAGARVVVSATSLGALESLVAEIRHAGGNAIGAFADASVFAHVSEVARTEVRITTPARRAARSRWVMKEREFGSTLCMRGFVCGGSGIGP